MLRPLAFMIYFERANDKNKMKQICILLTIVSIASARIVSVENDDGSYSVANAVLSLLTKSSGWTVDDPDIDRPPSVADYGVPPASSRSNGNSDGSYGAISINPAGILAPHLEILSLVENFIKLKGEVASRLQALFYDNYDLVMGVLKVLISKIGYLHSFSLAGITVLRKIIEFALQCMGQWTITGPSMSFGDSHQRSGSL